MRESLKGLTVTHAAKCLPIFDTGDIELRYHGVVTDLIEMLEIKPELGDFPADKVPVRFFGGPPGQYGWFDGTVYTYLCDKIMWCIANDDEDKLAKFLKFLQNG